MNLDEARKIMDCIPLRVGEELDMQRALDAIEADEQLRMCKSQEVVRDFVLVRAGEAKSAWKATARDGGNNA